MSLFAKPEKRIEPLIRVIIDFDDYDDLECAEVNPYGQHWEIGAPSVVAVERVDGLHEITHLEYYVPFTSEPPPPGELGVLAEPDAPSRFVTSKTTAQWVAETLREGGLSELIEDELDDFCDVSNLERVVLVGRPWSRTYNTPGEGWDYECGFEVEAVEEIIVR